MIKTVAGVWLGAWIGMALAQVGQTSPGSTYTWQLPVTVAIMLIIPFVLGYLVGKESEK